MQKFFYVLVGTRSKDHVPQCKPHIECCPAWQANEGKIYKKEVGSLKYLMICTEPDICFPAGHLLQNMETFSGSVGHWLNGVTGTLLDTNPWVFFRCSTAHVICPVWLIDSACAGCKSGHHLLDTSIHMDGGYFLEIRKAVGCYKHNIHFRIAYIRLLSARRHLPR